MAFYHVNSCSCPVGCCDCGTVDPYTATDKIVDDYIYNLRPKDLWMSKGLYATPEHLYERLRYKDEPAFGKNEFYVGQVDPVLSLKEAVGICYAFHGWLHANNFLHEDNGVKYMRTLIRALQDTGDFKEALGPYMEVLYIKTKTYL